MKYIDDLLSIKQYEVACIVLVCIGLSMSAWELSVLISIYFFIFRQPPPFYTQTKVLYMRIVFCILILFFFLPKRNDCSHLFSVVPIQSPAGAITIHLPSCVFITQHIIAHYSENAWKWNEINFNISFVSGLFSDWNGCMNEWNGLDGGTQKSNFQLCASSARDQ